MKTIYIITSGTLSPLENMKHIAPVRAFKKRKAALFYLQSEAAFLKRSYREDDHSDIFENHVTVEQPIEYIMSDEFCSKIYSPEYVLEIESKDKKGNKWIRYLKIEKIAVE